MVTTPIITFIADPNEPDLYNDINGLPNPFTMNVPIGISNTHPSSTLYFKASLVSPPSGFSNYVQQLGSVAHGASAIFIFSFQRASPTLTAGEYDESLTFRVDAYTDSGYSVAYANQTLVVIVHHFDHTDASWTIIDHASFDDNTCDGYLYDGNYYPPGDFALGQAFNPNPVGTFFLSSPGALSSGIGLGSSSGKAVNTSGKTKARAVFHFYCQSGCNCGVAINHVVKKNNLIPVPLNQWFRLSFSVPIGASIQINIAGAGGNNYLTYADEIWVIAK
jgi:hypothetical protein